MTDYERGVEQASSIYKEVIREYVAENSKLRELVLEIWRSCPVDKFDCARCPHCLEESNEVWCELQTRMRELGVEVDA